MINTLPLTVSRREQPQPRARVLLADDDRGIRESLGKLLRKSGYDVTFAAHGGHVLELVFNHDFDVVLLDLNMPEMDGWETLNHIQNFQPALPVIVITAQPNQLGWTRASGARVLMEKPLDLPLLLETVHELHTRRPAASGGSHGEGPERFKYLPPRPVELDVARRMRGWGINE
jgi:CheY-like chemotaxis protein